MQNKNQEPISKWGCAKAVAISFTAVVLLAAFIDKCDSPNKDGSPYSTGLVWLFLIVLVWALSRAKYKKGWFD